MTSCTRRAIALPASAAALATVALATQALTAVPAQSAAVHQRAGTSGWRLNKTISVRDASVILLDLDAVSAKDAWVAGVVLSEYGSTLAPLLEHWDGTAWRRVVLPAELTRHFTGQDVFGFVGASSASNVWAFAEDGKYLKRVGGHWTFGRLPASKTGRTFVASVKVFSSTDVWVFGSKSLGPVSRLKFAPFAARFDGHRWTVTSVPGKGAVGAVSAISSRSMWAVTDGDALLVDGPQASGSVVHWNGATWQKVAPQPKFPRPTILSGILARTSGDVWVGGGTRNSKQGASEVAWHWNGTAWRSKSPRSTPTRLLRYLSSLVPAPGGMWALGANVSGAAQVWRYCRGWSAPIRLPWNIFQLVAVPHADSVWAIGANSNLNAGLIVLHGPVPR